MLSADETILLELGKRIGSYRVNREITQAELARQAGVSKRTIERIEAGSSAQMVSIIRILRVLGLLQNLDQLVPDPAGRPMALLRRQQEKVRQRASSKRTPGRPESKWSWGEEI